MSVLNRVKSLISFVAVPKGRVMSTICSREEFSCILEREHARAERSGQGFSVVDFDIGNVELNRELISHLLAALAKRLRSTDEVGWLHGHNIGVLLYNTDEDGAKVFAKKILDIIPSTFDPPDFKIHTYAVKQQGGQDPAKDDSEQRAGDKFHKQEKRKEKAAKPVRQMRLLRSHAMPPWKRLLDIVASLILITITSPLFLVAAFLIKVGSPGPIFFRQKRVGYGGKLFTLYKFRTMQANADTTAHRKYVAELIHNGVEGEGSSKVMVKIDDPQIIPRGVFLRSTCIDELPQLFNVLRGEMSLVGPRPPIPYEVEEYVRWHTGRFDAVPGLTGLWQVSGKNRLTFRDMARLDIRYARQMSFSLDVTILLMTPLAIFYQVRDTVQGKYPRERIQ
jgi:lipopolysaccharide/colanic/teichoic acid biosynthesis glycosyltransferase